MGFNCKRKKNTIWTGFEYKCVFYQKQKKKWRNVIQTYNLLVVIWLYQNNSPFLKKISYYVSIYLDMCVGNKVLVN